MIIREVVVYSRLKAIGATVNNGIVWKQMAAAAAARVKVDIHNGVDSSRFWSHWIYYMTYELFRTVTVLLFQMYKLLLMLVCMVEW